VHNIRSPLRAVTGPLRFYYSLFLCNTMYLKLLVKNGQVVQGRLILSSMQSKRMKAENWVILQLFHY
jgi:hypothetical protein